MENHTPNDEAQQRFFEQVDLWDAEHRNSPEKLDDTSRNVNYL